MTNKYGIERLEGRGITAKVVDTGKLYSTYTDFAKASGHPDAAVNFRDRVATDKKAESAERLLGKVTKVVAKGKHGSSNDIIFVIQDEQTGEHFLFEEGGLEINVGADLREMSYDSLIEYSAEVFKEVRRRAYAEGYGQGKFDSAMDAVKAPTVNSVKLNECNRETPQQKRDRIVEQAKKDVEELKRPGTAFGETWLYAEELDGQSAYGLGSGDRYNAEFIIDKEKRTVVALLRGFRSGRVCKRGIAKCAPGDCFNVHIGKAIALRRALGLEVPTEYMNAPQPTEVCVGDIIEWGSLLRGKHREIVVRMAPEYDGSGQGKAFRTDDGIGWLGEKQVEIIDDSRTSEAEGEAK